MSPAELAFRCRQRVATLHDRVVAPAGVSRPACRLDRRLELPGDAKTDISPRQVTGEAAAALQRRFEQAFDLRFFAGAADSGHTAGIVGRDEAWRAAVIDSADAICRDRFAILGHGRLDFGSPVNWHLEPVAGVQAPAKHGSVVSYLDAEEVGDSKVIWELSRHQWALDLGQAWRLTGDERYAETFVRLLRAWMDRNPYGFGINWTSALEAALRLMSWTWALALFRGSASLTPGLFVDMLGWIGAHADFIERNLSRYFSPNTHLTGEALGLYYVGCVFPELERAASWKALGRRILVEELDCQVLDDGVYFEHSTRYQYYTVEIYLHFAILAGRNDDPLPPKVNEALRRMLEVLLHLRRPDGTLPLIGDADGGWLVPLVRRDPGDFNGLFSTGAVLLDDPRLAWAARRPRAETCWLLGCPDREGWTFPEPEPPEAAPLKCFETGGIAIVRSGWESTDNQLIFDTGPLAGDPSGAHGHADLLSVQLSIGGDNFLVDPGTGCYTASRSWRDHFRSTQAHSTVLVDGRGQAEPDGPFSWRRKPAARLTRAVARPDSVLVEAAHDAWADGEDPVVHRRRVHFVRGAYWLIVDDLEGQAEHRVDVRFQFGPFPLVEDSEGWIRAEGDHGALLMKAFSGAALETRIATGQQCPRAGWISPDYGQRVAAPALDFSANARLPLRIVTIIAPLSSVTDPAPDARPLMDGDRIVGLSIAAAPETIHFDDPDPEPARPESVIPGNMD